MMTPDLSNIPPPVDATHVDEWQPQPDGDRMIRWFNVSRSAVPVVDDDDLDADRWIVVVDGFQDQDGSSRRQIKLLIRAYGEDETTQATRLLPDEARKFAVRLLLAAEEIEQVEFGTTTYAEPDDE
jgi:hypothetical protein